VQKFVDLTCRALSVLMVVFLGMMVVMVFGNVVLRYGFNSGITVSEELSRWLFVWMTFLGSLVAARTSEPTPWSRACPWPERRSATPCPSSSCCSSAG